MDLILIQSGLAIFAVLGTLHLFYTALDVRDPKRFAPRDPDLLGKMQQTSGRLGSGSGKSYWQGLLGFHFSHSLGLLFYAAIFVAISLAAPDLLQTPLFMVLLLTPGIIYGVLSHLFWFYIPFWGSVSANGLMTAGLLLGN